MRMRNIVIFLLKIYRNYLSILKLQQSCIYYPSCSEYAISALEKYGFLRGSFISILRVLRCHPFSRGGYDPVKCRMEKYKEEVLRHPEELLKKSLHSG